MSPIKTRLIGWLRSAPRLYVSFALVALNTVLVLAVLDRGIAGMYRVKQRFFPARGYLPELSARFTPDGAPVPNGKRSGSYQVALFDRRAFGDSATDREIGEMLDEFHDLQSLPQSYLGAGLLNPPPFDGKHVRLLTDAAGVRYRWSASGTSTPEKDAVRVFVFGGSTTFGLHVADGHAWPSYLAQLLSESGRKVVVRNYGRLGYDASNELLLFLLLLQRGERPDLAVFLDGVNEGRVVRSGPFGDPDLAGLVARAYEPSVPRLADLPAVRDSGFALLARSLRRRMGHGDAPPPPRALAEDLDAEGAARRMADNYRRVTANIRAIGRANGVRTLFFLQPDATYNYPKHLFRKYPDFFTQAGREMKARFYGSVRKETDGIYLGDLFEKWGDRKAIVDDCHYSPAFAEFLARAVSPHVLAALRGR